MNIPILKIENLKIKNFKLITINFTINNYI